MMRPLVVLKDPPLHEGSAPGKTAVGLLLGLAAHGVGARALAARQHFAPPGVPPAGLPVELVDVAAERLGRLERLRRPRGELGRGTFAERARAAARDADLLHLEETETLWTGDGIRLPALVHVHYLVRRDRSLAAPWRREFRELVEFALAERAAVRRHRYLVASSPLVADALRRAAPRADVVVAPLSLDPAYYAPPPADPPPAAGLIGTAAWPPTAAAVHRLAARVWPLVRRTLPDARLRVAGRGMDGLVSAGEGIAVEGAVPSARDFMHGIAVLVFPLERGSGMKVKTLEALAAGVPVVTTAAGAEGIAGDEGLVVAEDDAGLAAAAARILRDDGERRERARAARAAFERRYSPKVATEPLVDLYGRMLG